LIKAVQARDITLLEHKLTRIIREGYMSGEVIGIGVKVLY